VRAVLTAQHRGGGRGSACDQGAHGVDTRHALHGGGRQHAESAAGDDLLPWVRERPVVFSGFPVWYFQKAQCQQLVDFVLHDIWGSPSRPRPRPPPWRQGGVRQVETLCLFVTPCSPWGEQGITFASPRRGGDRLAPRRISTSRGD
jgi:hypothetical protein